MLAPSGDGNNVKCGTGTMLTASECSAIDAPIVTPISCGMGTHQVGDQCIGFDAAILDCSSAIACPAATAGQFSVCGRVFDLETSSALDDGTPLDGEPSSQVMITAYDKVAFASDPTGATTIASVMLDTCGRFAIANAPSLSSGSIAIVTDDTAQAADDRVLTAISLPVSSGQNVAGVTAWTLRRSTDTGWSQSAGLSGPTFVQTGVAIEIFVDPTRPHVYPFAGTPVSEVTATRGGAVAATDDYYFSDTSAVARTMSGGVATGVDGTSLLRNGAGLRQYSGTGGEPTSCQWPSSLGFSSAGVAYVVEDVAVLTASPSMLCQ